MNNPISQTRRKSFQFGAPFDLSVCTGTRRTYMQPIRAGHAWLYGKGCPIPGFVPARLHIDCILVSVGASRYVLTP